METYVAFLRGINVGAHNRMAMADLRTALEAAGLSDPETYLQSGNVVLGTSRADDGGLADEISAAIESTFGYDVTVLVRECSDLVAVVDAWPFDPPAGENRQYATFVERAPSADQIERLLAAQSAAETFVVGDRVVYSELDKAALGDGRFTDVERVLGVPATRRTREVVTAVRDLAVGA